MTYPASMNEDFSFQSSFNAIYLVDSIVVESIPREYEAECNTIN